MAYRVEGNVLVAWPRPPAVPTRERRTFRFEADGSLVLEHDGGRMVPAKRAASAT